MLVECMSVSQRPDYANTLQDGATSWTYIFQGPVARRGQSTALSPLTPAAMLSMLAASLDVAWMAGYVLPGNTNMPLPAILSSCKLRSGLSCFYSMPITGPADNLPAA